MEEIYLLEVTNISQGRERVRELLSRRSFSNTGSTNSNSSEWDNSPFIIWNGTQITSRDLMECFPLCKNGRILIQANNGRVVRALPRFSNSYPSTPPDDGNYIFELENRGCYLVPIFSSNQQGVDNGPYHSDSNVQSPVHYNGYESSSSTQSTPNDNAQKSGRI